MTAHYDALETREHAAREAELFSRLPDVLRSAMSRARLCRAAQRRRSGRRDLQGDAGGPAGAAQVGTAGPAQGVPSPSAASWRRRPGSFARLFTSPGPIFEPEGRQADPWRGARALFAAGFRRGRRRAQHLQLSSHPRRLHLRFLGARARLRRDPGRARQYRAAVRADRGLPAGRLQRHAGLLEDIARCRRKRGPRRLLDQARAGLGRGLPALAPGRDQGARHRRLPGLRHRRSRPHRLRDRGARRHGRERGSDHGDRQARHRRSRRRPATSARSW